MKTITRTRVDVKTQFMMRHHEASIFIDVREAPSTGKQFDLFLAVDTESEIVRSRFCVLQAGMEFPDDSSETLYWFLLGSFTANQGHEIYFLYTTNEELATKGIGVEVE